MRCSKMRKRRSPGTCHTKPRDAPPVRSRAAAAKDAMAPPPLAVEGGGIGPGPAPSPDPGGPMMTSNAGEALTLNTSNSPSTHLLIRDKGGGKGRNRKITGVMESGCMRLAVIDHVHHSISMAFCQVVRSLRQLAPVIVDDCQKLQIHKQELQRCKSSPKQTRARCSHTLNPTRQQNNTNATSAVLHGLPEGS
jgi:hypothetical protein